MNSNTGANHRQFLLLSIISSLFVSCERRGDTPPSQLATSMSRTVLHGRIECDWNDKRLPRIHTSDGRRLCIFQADASHFQNHDLVSLEGELGFTDPEATVRSYRTHLVDDERQAGKLLAHPPEFPPPQIPQLHGAHLVKTEVFLLKRVLHRLSAP